VKHDEISLQQEAPSIRPVDIGQGQQMIRYRPSGAIRLRALAQLVVVQHDRMSDTDDC